MPGASLSLPNHRRGVFKRCPERAQSKQHLSLKLFLFFLFFPFPFLSLFSDIFLPRTSRIRSKNTWRERAGDYNVRRAVCRAFQEDLFKKCKDRFEGIHLLWTHLINIGSGFGGRLHILDPPLLSLPAGLFHRHLPALLQVRLVSYHQEWDLILLRLHPQDLLPAHTAARAVGYGDRPQ